MQVHGLDHVVLRVGDAERSLEWYCGALGLEAVRVDEWRRGEAPFPSVRVDATTIIDLLEGARGGENMDHLCLLVAPEDVDTAIGSDRFDVLEGPAPRFGAQGTGTSIYVRDPDGNLVELRHYG